MYHPSFLNAEKRGGLCDWLEQRGMPHAQNMKRPWGGVCYRTEQIEAVGTGSCCLYGTRVTRTHRNGRIRHGLGHSRKFFDRFPFGSQDSQCGSHLRICCSGTEQRVQKIRRFVARKIFSAHKTRSHLAKLDIAGFTHHALQVHVLLIWLAIASAFVIARALLTVSSYSRCGFESATMPAPA